MISVVLVILVVFVFLRTVRATIIPSIAVPLSLVGTFGVMYLLGYSLDNLSLMALAISTGFVVDDAIVVLENITRYIEHGMGAGAGRVPGCARDRFYRALHEHVAGRGVHSDTDDGRNRRPAVPRIRGHPERGHRCFAAGLTDDDPDHVRASCCVLPKEKHGTTCLIARARRSSIRLLAIYRHSLNGSAPSTRDVGRSRSRRRA